ncbi:Sapep family Mn(2+)-dependent dipeptidase [Ruminococcaceae bacterium OttesenSCG-928-L11]|nr:Sapep family Mn(2+)-dependent dipeptidase [Ruminococcaceae bacterium OttesenSCG-928-L11]
MDNMQERIRQWITAHEEDILRDLGRLIQYRSVSELDPSQEKRYGEACAAALEEFLAMGKEYGLDGFNREYRCGELIWDNGGKSIGLWGHLDVVPDNGEWVYPPYSLTRKGDFLIGRGVSDNKGPTVLSLYAVRCIRELGLPFHSTVRLFGGCAEETGMDDVEYYVKNYKAPDFNIVGDAGFPVCYAEKGVFDADLASPQLSGDVVELKAGTVTNIVPDLAQLTLKLTDAVTSGLSRLPADLSAEKGDGVVTVTARGLAKHSAMPEGSCNAIGKLLDGVLQAGLLGKSDAKALGFIRDICVVYDGDPVGVRFSDEESGPLTCVGSVVKTVDSKAVLSINIRYPVTTKEGWLEQQITAAATAAGYQVVHLDDNKPNYVDKNSFFVEALMNAYNQVTGENAEPYTMGGGTYARKIPNAVAFGLSLPYDFSELGLPEGHGSYHCPDESYSVSLMLKGLEIYVLSLLELDKRI